MKKLGVIAVGLTMVLSSCTVMNSGDSGYDDVYTSSSNPKAENQQYTQKAPVEKRVVQTESPDQGVAPVENVQQEPVLETQNNAQYAEPRQSNSQSYTDENGNTYVTNNYYSDDEYDFYYASRIRRFHNYDYGWGYYDPWYTNQYWYSYNPCSWGVSIYMGYNWMWGNSFYRPYDYYAPGYWSYGGFGYNHGYNHGYWDGYRDGYYGNGYNNYSDYYYNSHDDNTTHYYGHRSSIGSSGGFTGGGHRSASSTGSMSSNTGDNNRNTAFGERYENTIRRTPANVSTTAGAPMEKRSTPDRGVVNQRQTTTQSSGAVNNRASVPNQRVETPTTPGVPTATPGRANNTTVNTGRVENSTTPGATNTTPARGSYARPNPTEANRPQSNGAYSRPNAQEGTTAPAANNGRNSNGYVAPTTTNTRQSNYNYQKPAEPETKSYNTNRTNGSNPSYYNYQRNDNNGQYSTPSRTNTTTPTYSRPTQSNEAKTYNSNTTTRSSQEYSVPSNSNRGSNYSQPSNNSNYSKPSSSSSTYSAPSSGSSRGSYSAPSSTPSRSSGSSGSGSSSGGTRSSGSSSGGRHR